MILETPLVSEKISTSDDCNWFNFSKVQN